MIALAQIFKIVAGLGQVAFAIWLLAKERRSAINVSFACAFGLNGIAYALFNLAKPGERAADSLPVLGRAAFNWLATIALLVFAILLHRGMRSRALAAFAASVVGLTVLFATIVNAAQNRVTPLAFGGIAIYPATAFVIGLLPFAFDASHTWPAYLAAALSINSVDHLGAEVISPSPSSRLVVAVQIGAMLIVLLLWIAKMRAVETAGVRLCVLVLACLVIPFAAGVAVRLATGSYRGVQQSGFIGAGRVAATFVLMYGMARSTRGAACHR